MNSIVMSGGGSHGAYQVGVIKSLTEKGHSWGLAAGVSVGAINSALVAMYKPAEQRGAAVQLEKFWTDIKGNDSVYVNWWCGPGAGLWLGGFFDTAPLNKLVSRHFDPKRVAASGVKLSVGTASLCTGEYKNIRCEDDPSRFADWIMASAAMPAIFPPHKIDNDYWTDGGVRDSTPVSDVLRAVDGHVDVVLTGPYGKPLKPMPSKSFTGVIAVAARAVQILADEVFQNDIAGLSAADRARITI